MEKKQVVNEEVTNPSGSEPEKTQVEETVIEEQKPQPEAGSKTDSALLLKSLKDEREKRRELEERLEILESSSPSETDYSDEGKSLKKEISNLQMKITQMEEREDLNKVYSQFPELKSVSSEFDEFRKEYPRHKLENVAKLFRIEKGLDEPTRKGLEKTTGGPRTPGSDKMTSEEKVELMKTNFRKYKQLLLEGKI